MSLRRGMRVQVRRWDGTILTGTLRYLSRYSDPAEVATRLDSSSERRVYGPYYRRRPPLWWTSRADVICIEPKSIYESPPRYGPYTPKAKALP